MKDWIWLRVVFSKQSIRMSSLCCMESRKMMTMHVSSQLGAMVYEECNLRTWSLYSKLTWYPFPRRSTLDSAVSWCFPRNQPNAHVKLANDDITERPIWEIVIHKCSSKGLSPLEIDTKIRNAWYSTILLRSLCPTMRNYKLSGLEFNTFTDLRKWIFYSLKVNATGALFIPLCDRKSLWQPIAHRGECNILQPNSASRISISPSILKFENIPKSVLCNIRFDGGETSHQKCLPLFPLHLRRVCFSTQLAYCNRVPYLRRKIPLFLRASPSNTGMTRPFLSTNCNLSPIVYTLPQIPTFWDCLSMKRTTFLFQKQCTQNWSGRTAPLSILPRQ